MFNSHFAVGLILALLMGACGQLDRKSATNERTQTGGAASESVAQQEDEGTAKTEGTPPIETKRYESVESFTLAQKKDGKAKADPIADLYTKAFKIISELYATNKDVSVVSVAYSVTDKTGTDACAYVQIQQGRWGEPTVLETLTPEGQAEKCVPTRKKGLGFGSIGFLIKLSGNNYAGGVGIGAVAYDGKNLAGCAAGAVGYASELANAANGTYGAWCSEIIAVQ